MATHPGSPGPDAAPRKSRKALWIVLGVVIFIVICIVGFAAFGFYFLASNLEMQPATPIEAGASFDDVRARFKEEPVIALDDQERVTLTRRPPDQPPAEKPQSMRVMAYDDADSRIVRVTIPFWMLRMGRENIKLGTGHGLDFEKLQLSAEELERYGPTLLLDHRDRRGRRVLVWTQ
jgi:flagellar basal body-associated protein FliL